MTAVTAYRPHRLTRRPGQWVKWAARGEGVTRCDGCGHPARHGWGFLNAGQTTTASAFVCDTCAGALAGGTS